MITGKFKPILWTKYRTNFSKSSLRFFFRNYPWFQAEFLPWLLDSLEFCQKASRNPAMELQNNSKMFEGKSWKIILIISYLIPSSFLVVLIHSLHRFYYHSANFGSESIPGVLQQISSEDFKARYISKIYFLNSFCIFREFLNWSFQVKKNLTQFLMYFENISEGLLINFAK